MKFSNFLSKIDVSMIFKNHWNTLVNYNTKRIGINDIVVFLLFPVVIYSILLFYKIFLKENALNILITTMTVLVGLLFNVLVILFDIMRRDNKNTLLKNILKQVLANISFTVLLSIIIILFSLMTHFSDLTLKSIMTWIVYFLLGNFILTVLMILKRIFKLFENELEAT